MKTTLENLNSGYVVLIPFSGMRGGRLRIYQLVVGGASNEDEAIRRAGSEIVARFPNRQFQRGATAHPVVRTPKLAAALFAEGWHD
jgi:hypothetical protein